MTAKILVDLGFGDSGKGITTDYLCSLHPPGETMVIRFSGGQQAGHCVMLGDKKHVHQSFGSGTLRGVPSFFSEHCTIYLNNLNIEKQVLESKGIKPELYIHPLAKLTTPYDVWAGRARENLNNHGSCGQGVGATMMRHNNTGYKLFAIDLLNPTVLDQKLRAIENYYRHVDKSRMLPTQAVMGYDGLIEDIMEFNKIAKNLPFQIANYDLLQDYKHLIFEGSQGIMLDMDHGIFPHVTYANTTSKNAIEICEKLKIRYPEMFYVTRCYQTRHGKGWMSNNKDIKLVNNQEEINVYNKHQGDFKVGEVDYDLLKYAIEIDLLYSGDKVKRNTLVVTCNDQRPDFKFNTSLIKPYVEDCLMSYSPYSSSFKQIKL